MEANEVTWQEALEAITALFQGRGPFNAAEERQVMNVWVKHPSEVMDLAENVGHQYAAGTVSRPWAYLASAAASAGEKRPVNRGKTANPILELDQAEIRVSAWMRVAGCFFDRWPEVEAELFGDRGTLHPWRRDETLKAAWRERWEAERHRGARVEIEQQMRADLWGLSKAAQRWTKREPAEVAATVEHWTEGRIREAWARGRPIPAGCGDTDPVVSSRGDGTDFSPTEVLDIWHEVIGERDASPPPPAKPHVVAAGDVLADLADL